MSRSCLILAGFALEFIGGGLAGYALHRLGAKPRHYWLVAGSVMLVAVGAALVRFGMAS
jgi:hypothetical protein